MHAILPDLLRVANANARRMGWSREFYALKDRLLREYGQKQEACDIQHIADTCYTCYGSGKIDPPRVGAYAEKCYHCYGTGIYQHRYVLLERWQLGPLTFHANPVRLSTPQASTISGFIEHPGVEYDDSMRAFFCLAALYDPPLALRLAKTRRYKYGCEWWPGRELLRPSKPEPAAAA